MSNKKVLVIIPAYNEAIHIAKVIKNCKSEGFQNILVVDDGSDDNTLAIATENGAKVYSSSNKQRSWSSNSD